MENNLCITVFTSAKSAVCLPHLQHVNIVSSFLPAEMKNGPESVSFHHKYRSLQSLPSHCYSPESKASSNHLDQPIITDG